MCEGEGSDERCHPDGIERPISYPHTPPLPTLPAAFAEHLGIPELLVASTCSLDRRPEAAAELVGKVEGLVLGVYRCDLRFSAPYRWWPHRRRRAWGKERTASSGIGPTGAGASVHGDVLICVVPQADLDTSIRNTSDGADSAPLLLTAVTQ